MEDHATDGGDAPLGMRDYILICRLTDQPIGVIRARTPHEACSHGEVASSLESDPANWTKVRESDPEARFDVYTPKDDWVPSWTTVQDMPVLDIAERSAFAGSWAIKPEVLERERMDLEEEEELEDDRWRPDPTDPRVPDHVHAEEAAEGDPEEEPRDPYEADPTEVRPACGTAAVEAAPEEEGDDPEPAGDVWSDPLDDHSGLPLHDPESQDGEEPESEPKAWVRETLPPGPRHGHRKGRGSQGQEAAG